MIKLFTRAAAVVAAVAFSTTAMADGGPRRGSVKDAPMAAPMSWTGFYGGVNIGWARAETSAGVAGLTAGDAFLDAAIAAGLVPGRHNANGDGVIGGVQVGYNRQFQGVVIGVEADFAGSTANPQSDITTSLVGVAVNRSVYTQNLEALGTIRGRLGVLATPDLLAYVTAGFAFAQIERTYGASGLVLLGETFGRSKDWNTGWTVGGGLERAIGSNMTIGAEYLFVNLDGTSFASTNLTGGCALFNDCKARVSSGDTDLHIVRLKLNYKF